MQSWNKPVGWLLIVAAVITFPIPILPTFLLVGGLRFLGIDKEKLGAVINKFLGKADFKLP